MKRVAAAVAGVVLVGALTVECDDGPPCVDSHVETTWMPVFNGKTTTLQPVITTVCDRYAEPKETAQ
ncbi:hypothetical protein HOV12_gp50 [Streptomyces phage Lilbooboo]|uniref:Uncharacterized protein n=1 Tax=Streptomyces phage Lilbooboo TaxID=2510571 RepID=A0A411B318_9CAUD|nr:hypothetical protein HOV12_gp50 [Streptomyces phage Lilbooboo]QAX94742.1 hypothetical protein SEA_LILBOOBOO_43 [Streptomyces phage Lilbooboo]